MTLASQALDAQNGDFISRVRQSIIAAALAISSELTGVANHPNRVLLAKNVLNSPDFYAVAFAQGVASQAINGASTDAQINTAVSSIWNGYAGVV